MHSYHYSEENKILCIISVVYGHAELFWSLAAHARIRFDMNFLSCKIGLWYTGGLVKEGKRGSICRRNRLTIRFGNSLI
jgi:hypothetical protein